MSTALAEPEPSKPQHPAWSCDGCPVHLRRVTEAAVRRKLTRDLRGGDYLERRYDRREG